MDFLSINSVNNYLQTMNMENKWEMKKSSKDYKADGKKTIAEWAEEQKKELDETMNGKKKKSELENDKTYKNIVNKYSAGNKLSRTEIAYLRDKDPVMYQKAKAAQAEQENYERSLRKCKTKDDVQRLKLHHVSSSLAALNEIKNNPRISGEKKLEYIVEEKRKCDAIEKITVKFVKSPEYSKMPTDAEHRRAEKRKRDEFKSSTEGTKKCRQIITESRSKDTKEAVSQKKIHAHEEENAERKAITSAEKGNSENSKTAEDKKKGTVRIKTALKKSARKPVRKLNRKV